MKRKVITQNKLLVTIYLIIFVLVALLILVKRDEYISSSEKTNNMYLIKDELSNFNTIVSKASEDINLRDIPRMYMTYAQILEVSNQKNNIYQSEQRYIREKDKFNYEPIAKATMVFLINEKKVNEEISSWRDLKNSDYKVTAFWRDPPTLLAASMAYGSDESDISAGGELFCWLKDQNRLVKLHNYEKEDQNLINVNAINNIEVAVLWDYQAAYIIKHMNQDLKIKVPADGTLETTIGIATTAESGHVREKFESFVDYIRGDKGQELLVKNYYRTMNNEANRAFYPEESEYKSAKRINDVSLWNKTILFYYNGKYELKKIVTLSLAGILVVLWTYHTIKRWPCKGTRKYFILISVFLIFWICLRYLKTNIISSDMETLIWHAYYIPMQSIAILWAFICYEHRFNKKVPDIARKIIIIIGILFVVGFLTNGFHNAMFKIDMLEYKSNDIYYRNYGYYLFVIWAIALVLSGSYNSIKAVIKKDIEIVMSVIVGHFFIAIFCVIYALYIIRWDFTITMIFLIIANIELAIRTVFFRQQHITHPFFKGSAMILAIYNMRKEIVYISDSGELLREFLGVSFLDRYEEFIDCKKFRFSMGSDKRYLACIESIDNGYFLSMESVDGIYNLREELREKNKSLKNKREYLDKEKNVLEELKRLEFGTEILDTIEKETEASLNRLREYIRELYSGKNIKEAADNIYLTCKYIKQKTQMSVLSMNKELLDKEYAQSMIEELVGSIRNKDIDAFFTVVGEKCIPVKTFLLLNEIVFLIILSLYKYDSPSMYARIVNFEDYIELMVTLDLNSKDMIKLLEIVEKERTRKVRSREVVDFVVKIEEESAFLTGKILKGENN